MQPDELDKLFRGGLEGHRTPPPRALWERLEDELHPPRQRRRAAWWPLAVAAVVTLLLVADGAGLWGGTRHPATSAGRGGELVASRPATNTTAGLKEIQKAVEASRAPKATSLLAHHAATAETRAALATAAMGSSKAASTEVGAAVRGRRADDRPRLKATVALAQNFPKKMPAAQATRLRRTASTPSNAGLLAGQVATARRPQAVVLGAQSAGPVAPAPRAAPAADLATAAAVPTPASATPAEVIEVEVRRGGGPGLAPVAASPQKSVLAVAPLEGEAPRARRGLLRGGLGQQLDGVLGGAGRVVRTARQGYKALRELPSNVTVQARVGERTVSKTLEL